MPTESLNPPIDDKRTKESLMVTKKQVLQQLVEKLKTQLGVLTDSRDNKRELAIDSPGANQSHSDTNKFQLSNLQLGLDLRRIETEKTIFLLKQIQLNLCNKVTLGAIFTICKTDDGSRKNYFLVSAGGGEILKLDDLEVVSTTPQAPIAKACLQKEEGDVFKFQDKEFEITRII